MSADISIHPTDCPISVKFPDGAIAQSIGTANIALPSTTGSLPAHVFSNDTLQHSLFGLTELTEQGCDVTFSKKGLALYHDGNRIHYSPKLPMDMFWQLPIAPALPSTTPEPVASANSLISLP